MRPRILNSLERASALDRPGGALLRGVRALVRSRRVHDVLHGVWLGHPLHPALVVLPIGSWIGAGVLDALPGRRRVAGILVGTGIATAVPTALAGSTDFTTLSPEQRRVGLVHATANSAALTLYLGSLIARRRGRYGLGKALAYLGLGAVGLGGYLGGDLSYRQAAGVSAAAGQLRRIPEGWHSLGEIDDLPEDRPSVHSVSEVPVLVYRQGDQVSVLIEHCAHQSGPLGKGEVTQIDGATCVVCPWHGSTFRLLDGAVVSGPAATDQQTLRSRLVDGRLEVAVP